METELYQQLAIALGLGLLVGFQREWDAQNLAGIRTFALLTVFGTVCGRLAGEFGVWVVPAGMLALALLFIVGTYARFSGLPKDARESGSSGSVAQVETILSGDAETTHEFHPQQNRDVEPGLTTPIAALLMYIVGAALVTPFVKAAIVVGGSVAVLLHWKAPLHRFVDRIGERHIRGIIQLVLIALVILPVLPNRTFGPYDVLNPFEIWLMVVLIVGISVGGYAIYMFLGPRSGSLLAGVLGGIISSTATTASYARRTREAPDNAALAALVIMVASTVVFVRVAFEVALVAPGSLRSLLPPLAAMMGVMIAVTAVSWLFSRGNAEPIPIDDDPSELKTAVVFGLLYAVVIFAVAAVKTEFGNRGLYLVAAVSGLTDMDAITLSTAKLVEADRLDINTGWRMILIGALSNLVFKCGAVAVLGHRRLLTRIAILFTMSLAGGAALILLWPDV